MVNGKLKIVDRKARIQIHLPKFAFNVPAGLMTKGNISNNYGVNYLPWICN